MILAWSYDYLKMKVKWCMWLGSHLPHFWNEVCGWAATYLISKMLYVAWQPLTSFLGATPTPHSSLAQIHIYIVNIYLRRHLFTSFENMTFNKKVNYLLRKYDFPFENMICLKKVNYLLRKYNSLIGDIVCKRKLIYCFEYMVFPFEDLT